MDGVRLAQSPADQDKPVANSEVATAQEGDQQSQDADISEQPNIIISTDGSPPTSIEGILNFVNRLPGGKPISSMGGFAIGAVEGIFGNLNTLGTAQIKAVGEKTNQIRHTLSQARARGQEFVGVFSSPKEYADEQADEHEKDGLNWDKVFTEFETNIDDIDTRHLLLRKFCRRAQNLIQQLSIEESEDARLWLKQIGIALESVPGNPFAGLGLRPTEIETLANYFSLPMPEVSSVVFDKKVDTPPQLTNDF